MLEVGRLREEKAREKRYVRVLYIRNGIIIKYTRLGLDVFVSLKTKADR